MLIKKIKNYYKYYYKYYKYYNERFYKIGYTRYNNLLILIYILSFTNLENLYAIITCNSWAICLSFHSIYLYDNNFFIKFAIKENVTINKFYLYNFIFHINPFLFTILFPPKFIYLWHSIFTVILQLSWGLLVTKNTLCFNNIYIPYPRYVWYTIIIQMFIIDISVPLIYNYYKI